MSRLTMSAPLPTKQKVEQILGPQSEVHATAFVKLYISTDSRWEWSQITGAAAIVTNKAENTRYIHVVDINNNTIPFSQEVYEHFTYEANRDFFHAFEMDDCVAGFSFADVNEAKAFHSLVTSGAAARPPLPTGRSPAVPPTLARPTTLPPTPPKPTPPIPSGALPQVPPQPQPSPVQPIPTPYEAPTHYDPPAQPAHTQHRSVSVPAPAQSASAPARPSDAASKKKPKQGLFGKLKSAFAGSDVPEDFAISDPKGFRHESHIGWDPNAGFEIRNIPPEWRKLFQAAGVKKSELRDAETAKFVMNVIGDTILQSGGSLPEGLPHMAPPPPPTMAANAPPPPPVPKAPAPPPPPTPGAPRTPATPSAAVVNPRGDLLSAIQQGTSLRKAEDRPVSSLPNLDNLNANQSNTLVNTLAAAMAARRPALQQEEDEEEEDEEDEWSD